MRDRLITYIMQANEPMISLATAERLADKLLEKGVIVPPCKWGDTLYYVERGCVKEVIVNEMNLNGGNGFSFLLGFDCDDDCPNCPFDSWHQDYSGEYRCDGEWGCIDANSTDFGKIVFLTREEAEKSLETSEGEGK